MPRPRPLDRRPLERVLVATDFSRTADHALARVARLPLAPGASLIILHVLPPRLPAPLRASETAEAQGRLAQAAARLTRAFRRRKAGGIDVWTELIRGEPFLEIVRHSQAAGAELVVLGRHGMRRFRELLIGSTADRVIRKGGTPVLVVGGAVRGPYRRALVAMDLSDASRCALRLAERLLAPATRTIHVVHAYEVPHAQVLSRVALAPDRVAYQRQCRESARTAVTEMFDAVPGPPLARELALRRGDPRSVVLATARRERADLIAVGTHGRTRLADVLIGSVADAVIRHAKGDVLVATPEAQALVRSVPQ